MLLEKAEWLPLKNMQFRPGEKRYLKKDILAKLVESQVCSRRVTGSRAYLKWQPVHSTLSQTPFAFPGTVPGREYIGVVSFMKYRVATTARTLSHHPGGYLDIQTPPGGSTNFEKMQTGWTLLLPGH